MTQIYLYIVVSLYATVSSADFEFYRGARQMGMGGASIAVVNDETSVLSNPNGLGRLRDNFLTILDPELVGSSTHASTLTETAIVDAINPSKTYEALSGKLQDPFYFKGQVFPSIVLPNFGLGLLGRYEVLARRNGDGTFDYNYQNDYSLNLAYNLRFWGGRIKWGVAGRYISRVEYFGTRDPATESLELSNYAREGSGISVDTGLTLTAPWQWLPTLTVYVRDVGHTSFTFGDGLFGNSSNGTPNSVAQSIDAAIAIFPIVSKFSRSTFTIEYTGVDGGNPDIEEENRLHIGYELNLFDAYFLRAGYHNSEYTAGFEYASGIMQVQFATYAEQVTFGTTSQMDRRGQFKFAVRF